MIRKWWNEFWSKKTWNYTFSFLGITIKCKINKY